MNKTCGWLQTFINESVRRRRGSGTHKSPMCVSMDVDNNLDTCVYWRGIARGGREKGQVMSIRIGRHKGVCVPE